MSCFGYNGRLAFEGNLVLDTSHLQSDEVSNNGQGGPLSSRVHRKPRGIGHLSSIRQPNSARVGGSSYEQGSTNYRYKENGNHQPSTISETATKIECAACYEEFDTGLTVRSSDTCNHHLCIGCMTQKVRLSLNERQNEFDSPNGYEN